MTDPQNWQSPTPGPSADPAGQRPDAPRYGEHAAPTGGFAAAPSGAPNGWAPPPKPGLIPLRPLGFGTLLAAPFQVLKRNPKATFGSALLVQAVSLIISLLVIGLVTYFAVGRIEAAPIDEQDAVSAGAALTIVLSAILPIALSVIASALLQGVIVLEVARATLGEKLRLNVLWRTAGRRLWTLVLWTLVLSAALLVGVGLIAGIVTLLVLLGGTWIVLAVVIGIFGGLGLLVCGAWLFTRTSLVPSLIVLERLTIRQAVRRSWSLTIGYFWRTLGVQFLVATIVNVITQVVVTPLSFLFSISFSLVDPNGALDSFIPSAIVYVLVLLVSLVLGAIAAVVQSATTALIYIDLRMRKEGLDLELQRFVEAAHSGSPGSQALPDPYLPVPAQNRRSSVQPDVGSPWA
ncbi:hypothetical protein [Leifsonia kafniensis]|uniref:hypothetical protein n=1 Tax=Leifsonia kafniensis TaxID=475957 RepID=UPI0031EFF94B